jgi:hypothetical protein
MRGEEEAIVSEPEIVLHSKRMFNVLVKIIQIDVSEYLRREVPDRSPLSNSTFYVEAVDNVSQEMKHSVVVNYSRQRLFEDLVVNGIIEALNVAFECPAGACKVFAHLPNCALQRIYRPVGALADAI